MLRLQALVSGVGTLLERMLHAGGVCVLPVEKKILVLVNLNGNKILFPIRNN